MMISPTTRFGNCVGDSFLTRLLRRTRRVTKARTGIDAQRMTTIVIIVEYGAPPAIANCSSQNPTAAPTASKIDCARRSDRVEESTGRAVVTTPPIAITMPVMHDAEGLTPLNIPMMTGMMTPSAAIGATTPIVPIANAGFRMRRARTR